MGWVDALYLLLRACVISRATLAAEHLALRQQPSVLAHAVQRPALRPRDRRFRVWLARLWPNWRSVLRLVQPDTVTTWHTMGCTRSWRWQSTPREAGQPPIDQDIRDVMRRMACDNPTWGAPPIQSALRLVGSHVAQATGATYMPTTRKPPSRTWRTVLDNHVPDIASIDCWLQVSAGGRVLLWHFGSTKQDDAAKEEPDGIFSNDKWR